MSSDWIKVIAILNHGILGVFLHKEVYKRKQFQANWKTAQCHY